MEQTAPAGADTGANEEPADGEIVGGPPPAPLDDDEDVAEAEIVEWPLAPLSAYGSVPSSDYSDAGVPSLDYVRDKIEGRHATAIGGVELAEAGAAREAAARAVSDQQAARTAEEQRLAREQAGKDRLEEIRRSLRP